MHQSLNTYLQNELLRLWIFKRVGKKKRKELTSGPSKTILKKKPRAKHKRRTIRLSGSRAPAGRSRQRRREMHVEWTRTTLNYRWQRALNAKPLLRLDICWMKYLFSAWIPGNIRNLLWGLTAHTMSLHPLLFDLVMSRMGVFGGLVLSRKRGPMAKRDSHRDTKTLRLGIRGDHFRVCAFQHFILAIGFLLGLRLASLFRTPDIPEAAGSDFWGLLISEWIG